MKQTNPYFDSVDLDKQLAKSPYYTDTDSIQIHRKNISSLKLDKEIGGISDDLGDNCKILCGGWIAPKLYFFLEYVDKNREVKCHLRGKGVAKDKLTIKMFNFACSRTTSAYESGKISQRAGSEHAIEKIFGK